MIAPPTKIEMVGDTLAVLWADGVEDFFSMEFLRAASPSADQAGEPDIFGNKIGGSDQTSFPGVRIVGWQPVGSYAVQLYFTDGHRTGLYSFEYLKRLATPLSADGGGE